MCNGLIKVCFHCIIYCKIMYKHIIFVEGGPVYMSIKSHLNCIFALLLPNVCRWPCLHCSHYPQFCGRRYCLCVYCTACLIAFRFVFLPALFSLSQYATLTVNARPLRNYIPQVCTKDDTIFQLIIKFRKFGLARAG